MRKPTPSLTNTTISILVLSTALLTAAFSAGARAATVSYSVSALGGQAYRYDYTITNDASLVTGLALSGIDIYFAPDLYDSASLEILSYPALTTDWDQLILQPGIGVPAAFDAVANGTGIEPGESLGGFAVKFAWLGNGVPGNQPFEIFDPLSFEVTQSGVTNPVPLPPAILLLTSGILVMVRLTRST